MNAFGLGVRPCRPPVAPAIAAPLLSAVDAAGWSAQWVGTPPTFTPDTAPQTVGVTRQGFDATGAATSFAEARTFTTRVRAAYPTQTVGPIGSTPIAWTPAGVALDDYLYATDAIAGVVNNSAEVSPKPVAAWAMPGRSLVGNALDWELVAFHRDFRAGRQVACVQVQASDGTTTTAWQTVSTTVISTLCEDANPVEVYRGTLDISALATGLVTLRGRVLPWVGAAASILDSADQNAPREFSARYFYKDATRLAAPPLAYVASTGSDTTGVWSTSAATAAATPFLTVGGALMALNDATRGTPATGSYADGCRIRVVDTVALGTTTTSRPQRVAAAIVERAPGTARAAAVVTMSATMRPRFGVGTLLGGLTEGALRFADVTVSRTANVTFQGEAANPLNVQFHNVAFANGGIAGTIHSNSHAWWFGAAWSGYNGNLAGTAEQRLTRGLTGDLANTVYQQWVTVGCALTRPGTPALLAGGEAKGVLLYANRLLNPISTSSPINVDGAAAGDTVTGVVIVQNLIEVTHTTSSSPGLRVSSDNGVANTLHTVAAYNTVTGYAGVGRWNFLYDESTTATTRRTHRLARMVGNIGPQLNQKGDIFVAGSGAQPAEAPNRLGHFALHHGVGAAGNLFLFRVASTTFLSEYQLYAGLKSEVGTDPNASLYAPATVWTNYQGTTGSGGVPVAGAGGGSYTLAAGSPARGKVAVAGLAFDLAGAARPASADSAGSYA